MPAPCQRVWGPRSDGGDRDVVKSAQGHEQRAAVGGECHRGVLACSRSGKGMRHPRSHQHHLMRGSKTYGLHYSPSKDITLVVHLAKRHHNALALERRQVKLGGGPLALGLRNRSIGGDDSAQAGQGGGGRVTLLWGGWEGREGGCVKGGSSRLGCARCMQPETGAWLKTKGCMQCAAKQSATS